MEASVPLSWRLPPVPGVHVVELRMDPGRRDRLMLRVEHTFDVAELAVYDVAGLRDWLGRIQEHMK